MEEEVKHQKVPALKSIINDIEMKRRVGMTPSADSSELKRLMKGLKINIVQSSRILIWHILPISETKILKG